MLLILLLYIELRQRSVGSPGTLHRPVSEPSLAETPSHKAASNKPETAPNSPSHARASPNVQRKAINAMAVPPGTPGEYLTFLILSNL